MYYSSNCFFVLRSNAAVWYILLYLWYIYLRSFWSLTSTKKVAMSSIFQQYWYIGSLPATVFTEVSASDSADEVK